MPWKHFSFIYFYFSRSFSWESVRPCCGTLICLWRKQLSCENINITAESIRYRRRPEQRRLYQSTKISFATLNIQYAHNGGKIVIIPISIIMFQLQFVVWPQRLLQLLVFAWRKLWFWTLVDFFRLRARWYFSSTDRMMWINFWNETEVKLVRERKANGIIENLSWWLFYVIRSVL